jgi:hypothetical protein
MHVLLSSDLDFWTSLAKKRFVQASQTLAFDTVFSYAYQADNSYLKEALGCALIFRAGTTKTFESCSFRRTYTLCLCNASPLTCRVRSLLKHRPTIDSCKSKANNFLSISHFVALSAAVQVVEVSELSQPRLLRPYRPHTDPCQQWQKQW